MKSQSKEISFPTTELPKLVKSRRRWSIGRSVRSMASSLWIPVLIEASSIRNASILFEASLVLWHFLNNFLFVEKLISALDLYEGDLNLEMSFN